MRSWLQVLAAGYLLLPLLWVQLSCGLPENESPAQVDTAAVSGAASSTEGPLHGTQGVESSSAPNDGEEDSTGLGLEGEHYLIRHMNEFLETLGFPENYAQDWLESVSQRTTDGSMAMRDQELMASWLEALPKDMFKSPTTNGTTNASYTAPTNTSTSLRTQFATALLNETLLYGFSNFVASHDVASSSASGLASNSSANDDMLRWLEAAGGAHPDLNIRDDNVAGRTVVAVRDIGSRQLVASIPRATLIRVAAAVRASKTARILYDYALKHLLDLTPKSTDSTARDANERIIIAAFLVEARYNASSFFKPYIDILPRSLPHLPLYWSPEELADARCGSLHDDILMQRASMVVEYNLIVRLVPEFGERYQLQDYVWARAIILTRAFRVTLSYPDSDSSSMMPAWAVNPASGVAGEALPTQASYFPTCANDILILAPLADMLNHEPTPNTAWRFSSQLDAFTFVATRSIASGAPIFDSYGKKSNNAMLRVFGFSDRNLTHLQAGLLKKTKVAIVFSRSDYLTQCLPEEHPERRQCPHLSFIDMLRLPSPFP